MKNKSILKTAQRLFTFLMVIYGLFIILITFVITYSCIYPKSKFNDRIKLTIEKNNINISFVKNYDKSPETLLEYKDFGGSNVYFNKLNKLSKVKLLLLSVIPGIFYFLIFKELLHFFKSVRNYSTFFIQNSIHFKKIGWYLILTMCSSLIIIFFANGLNMEFPDGGVQKNIPLSINLASIIQYIAFILLSFTASLVFKEGESLRVENELTI